MYLILFENYENYCFIMFYYVQTVTVIINLDITYYFIFSFKDNSKTALHSFSFKLHSIKHEHNAIL